MTVDDLSRLTSGGETEHMEFKTSLADSKRIIETIAAMATLGGGTILVGVRDDGSIVGTELGEGAVEQFSQRVLAATDPRVFVRLHVHDLGGLTVLGVDVPPGDGPHLANGRAFIRSGPATVAMSRDEYERRLFDRLRESAGYERQPVPGTAADDIDVEAVRHFVTLAAPRGVSWHGDVSAVLDRLHLLRDGGLTVGALLLFGRDPERTLPQASVRLPVTRGAVEEGEPIGGGLLHVIEETVRQVQLRLRRQADRSGLMRREVDELPLVAVREAVVNAIAHRNYRSTAPIQVRLDDEKLQIWNPGHLPERLKVDALRRDHPSVPPNPRIARALHLAGFVEAWRTGMLRVVASMVGRGHGEPVFDAELGGFSVTLPLRRGTEDPALTERQTTLLAQLGSAGGSLRVARPREGPRRVNPHRPERSRRPRSPRPRRAGGPWQGGTLDPCASMTRPPTPPIRHPARSTRP